MFERLLIIGCGLMGGSFALAARRAGCVRTIVGLSQSQASIERALAMGVIDEGTQSWPQALQASDLILIATPVATISQMLSCLKDGVADQALIMDVGSTKQGIAQAAVDILGARAAQFIPAHPIAGREVSGVEHSDPDLYVGKRVILTPLPQIEQHLFLERAQALWRKLGALVSVMSAPEHDRALAAVSHFPHLAAFAFMLALLEQEGGAALLELAGSGFRDFSRIAASDPHMWRDVLLANGEQVLHQSRQFRGALTRLESLIEGARGPEIFSQITCASAARQRWGQAQAHAPRPEGQQ